LCVSTSAAVHPLLVPLLEGLADFAVFPLGSIRSGNARPPRLEDQTAFRDAKVLVPIPVTALEEVFLTASDVAKVASVYLFVYARVYS
jgi:hypothetical protein